jgi:hypothetical protein
VLEVLETELPLAGGRQRDPGAKLDLGSLERELEAVVYISWPARARSSFRRCIEGQIGTLASHCGR